MVSDSESQQLSRRILEIAAAQGMLTQESYDTVSTLDGDVCDQAIARDLISTATIDLLRPLADADRFLPGYHIEELIGQGGAGAVYRARQTALGRNVALKLLKSGVLEDATVTARSQLEARIGASLQHPGIVTVYDYGVHQQRIYLALELLTGESLESLIDRAGALDPQESLRIVRQVAAALRYANSEGVVHRDIKPGNLMLTDDNAGTSDLASGKVVKVTDFGLAFNSERANATRLTVAGATLGTPCYVAPEQLESTDVDQRADIYALGATLFHMVTGQQPFGNANGFKALAAKMQGSEEWLEAMDDSVPQPVRQLIIDMTKSDPASRIPDYEALATRVEKTLNGEMPDRIAVHTKSNDEPSTPPAPKSRSRTRWLLIAGLALLVPIAFAIQYLLPNESVQRDPGLTVVPERRVVSEERSEHTQPFRLLDVRSGVPNERHRGGWKISKDIQEGEVLEGQNGWLRYKLTREHKQSGYYHFKVDVDTSPGGDVDVCFGFEENGVCNIARVQKDRVILGRGRVSDEDEPNFGAAISDAYLQFESTGKEKRTLPSTPHESRIVVERQPDAWFVFVNGTALGAVPATEGDDPAIYLRVNEGRAHSSNTFVYVLQPVDSKNAVEP